MSVCTILVFTWDLKNTMNQYINTFDGRNAGYKSKKSRAETIPVFVFLSH